MKSNLISKSEIIFKSILVGLGAGFVSSMYRLALFYAEKASAYAYIFFRDNLIFLPVMFLTLIVLGYFVGCLVESDDMVSGSGLAHLKQALKKYYYFNMYWFSTLVKKFVGGVAAIFAGMSLGRGGISMHMGACIAEGIGNKIGKDSIQRRALIASGASSGLAATFNTPIGAVVFVLEEIFEDFSLTIVFSTITGAVIANFVSKRIFGTKPIFDFVLNRTIPLDNRYIVLIVLGLSVGILGVLFNLTLARVQKFYKGLNFLDRKNKIIVTFIATGIIGLFFPLVTGGGSKITEYLNIKSSIYFLLITLLIKAIFFIICLSSDAPGGMFFPTFIIGAMIGCIFACIMLKIGVYDESFFYNFVVLAMAGYLASAFKTPITAMVLIMEITHSFESWIAVVTVCTTSHLISKYLYNLNSYKRMIAD